MQRGQRAIGKFGLAGLLPALAITISGAPATAVGAEADEVEEIKVTGSRRAHRTGGDTLAPLDIISGRDFSRQGRGETTDMLRTLIPAYNVNAQPISDAATLIRPANLRGLSPDQTLVLVNGKRRHRAAVISFLGGGISDGAQGPDVSAIPAIALKQVEVLRDGASAQYGSDAIAGVINFVLRDDAEGGVVETKFGQTYSGDGEHRQLSANLGLPLGDAGFVNLSGDWKERDPTVRSVQTDNARKLIAAGNTAVEQPYAQVWGQPDLDDDWKGFVNMAAAFSDEAEFYAFGNYSERETEGGFFFRDPDERGDVFRDEATLGGVSVHTRLVGDRTPDNTADAACPDDVVIAARLTPAQRTALRNAGIDPEELEARRRREIAANANCFLFNDRFPGGFRPKFGGELTDEALTAGLRGEFDSGLTYDVSVSYGENEAEFFIRDTINASLGLAPLTAFRLGSYTQTEEDFNLDLSYPLTIDAFASPLNVAAGLEWRKEEFEVRQGEPDSWKAGPYAEQGFGVGANGFAGFGPDNAGKWDRSSRSRYLDLEADITDDLTLGGALRWEDFDDFGTTTIWKLSGLYRFYEQLRMRAAWHTGFRAPTVGQQNITNLTTAFGEDGLEQSGTVPPTTPLARALGGTPLRPEKSDSFTIGAIMDIAAAEVTLDYYYIAVNDRILQSKDFKLSDHVGPGPDQRFVNQAALNTAREKSGFAENVDLAVVKFFTNDFDTRTRGMDLVATVPLELLDSGESELTLAANWTKTKIVRHDPDTVDAKRIDQIEKSLPRFKGNATLTHDAEDWRALVRANYYGHALEYHLNREKLLVKYGAEVTWDLEFGYRPVPDLELVLGADNVFDNRPDENPHAGVAGSRYPESAAMGSQGGFYYMKASYEF